MVGVILEAISALIRSRTGLAGNVERTELDEVKVAAPTFLLPRPSCSPCLFPLGNNHREISSLILMKSVSRPTLCVAPLLAPNSAD